MTGRRRSARVLGERWRWLGFACGCGGGCCCGGVCGVLWVVVGEGVCLC
ncbi:hypothetical protein [Pseudomonas syringae group genomosp. 7]